MLSKSCGRCNSRHRTYLVTHFYPICNWPRIPVDMYMRGPHSFVPQSNLKTIHYRHGNNENRYPNGDTE